MCLFGRGVRWMGMDVCEEDLAMELFASLIDADR